MTKQASTTRPRGVRFAQTVSALSAALLVGVLAGRQSMAPSDAVRGRTSDVAAAKPVVSAAPGRSAVDAPPTSKPGAPVEATLLLPGSEACERALQEDERRVQQEQARQLISLLDIAVAHAERMFPGQETESIANQNYEYLRGWSDSVQKVAPDLAGELAAVVEERLCDPQASPAALMTLARVGLGFSELMTSRGIDCVVASRSEEDVVLWAALDSWRNAGLDTSEALDRLRAEARDPRTHRRFLSTEEELAQRLKGRTE